MALELSTLVFKVDTKQLTEAIEKTNQLSAAQKQLAAAMTKGSGSAGASQQQKQTRTQQDLLTKLDNLYKDLAQGATRWEASQLRAARQMGVPLEAVREQLVGIRKLSQDPFDSAIGSVRSITQYFEQLQNRISLANEGLILTAKQMREFSRIPFEVEGQMRAGGKDPKGADNGDYLRRIEQEERKYIDTARAANTLADAEKERANVLKQNAQASKFLATEMQRVDAVLAEMNNEFGLNANTGERSAAMVAKYSTALQRAGVSGVEAAAKLETYRAKVQQIAMQDEKRAATRLSRALTPQISDVAVSIAGGMPLHLVIMQQGLQIRDLIAQSGVAAQTLQGVFKTAAADMVKSIGGTIAALGSLTFGAIVDAGGAINSFATKIFGMNSVIDAMNKKFPEASASIMRFAGAISGIALTGFVLTASALVYEYVKLIGANNELARSLAVTGGVFGVTHASSQQYVEGLTKVGATTRDSIAIIGQMANAGNLSSQQMLLVGSSAVQMSKYAGIAIEDTVKSFSEMAKDPVKALTELAIKTGDVSPALMATVRELAEQGQTAQASALAVSALGDVMSKQSKRMQEDLHPLTMAAKSFLSTLSEGWTTLGNIINRAMGALPQQANILNKIVELEMSRADAFRTGADDETLAQIQEQLNAEQAKLDAIKKRTDAEAVLQKQQSDAAKKLRDADEIRLKYADKQYKLGQALQELSIKGADLSKEEYNKLEKAIRKQFEGSGVDKERTAQLKYSLSIQEKINDAYNQMVGKVKELNPLEKAILDIRDDPRYKQASPAQRIEIEKQIEAKRRLIAVFTDEAVTQRVLADIYKDVEALQKKSLEDISDLYRELSVHGEKYEKTLIAINLARATGAISSDEEAERLRKENMRKNSDAFKFGEKTREDQKQSSVALGSQQEELALRVRMIGKTDLAKQLMQDEFDTNKALREARAELDKNFIEVSKQADVSAMEELNSKYLDNYNKRVALIRGEAELKKTLLSEEVQRQKNFDDTMKRGFESMGDALIDFAVTGKSSFGDMIKQMLIDLAKLEMRLQMMKMYEAARGGSSGTGGGGMFGGLLKYGGTSFNPFASNYENSFDLMNGGGGFFSSLFSGLKFANGGEPPVGMASLVGEEGPELFVPKQQGTIIPNHQLGGTKKVVNVNQTNNIQIDSRSDQASIYAGVQSMLKQNNAQLVDSLQTGGYL